MQLSAPNGTRHVRVDTTDSVDPALLERRRISYHPPTETLLMTFGRSTAPARRTIALLGIAALTALASHDAGAQTAKKSKAKKTAAVAPVTPIRFSIGTTGNEARYRVREQL